MAARGRARARLVSSLWTAPTLTLYQSSMRAGDSHATTPYIYAPSYAR
jgi:hypothetical protein